MRGACAAISCLPAALALPGCMRTTSPVASIQPRSDLDAGGSITMPLIGAVPARGRTPAALAAEIGARLRNGYIREPSVAVQIDSYRPLFILGEVAAPGQYPYVPNMSVESAVAIAGGFTPRARRDRITQPHANGASPPRTVVPLGTALGPGDTVQVGERWF